MRWLVLNASVAIGLSGCASAPAAWDGMGQFGRGFGDAAGAPLEDLNLRRDPIPLVLRAAQSNPYDLRGLDRCPAMAREVADLNAALGPDMDEPPPPPGSRYDRAAGAAANLALDAVRDAVTDFVPGRSWIRRLTGAERHSRQVQDAIQAGRLRRAFVKGVGMQRNCPPPAAPSWFRPTPSRR